jgi:hypothetical protein
MLTGLFEFETLRYAAWAALIALSVATFLAIFCSRRAIRLVFQISYQTAKEPHHGVTLRHGFIALFALIGAALALEISSQELLPLRIILVVISAGVMGITGAWIWQTVSIESARRSEERDWWERRSAICAAEFVNALDADDIRNSLCQMLARELGASPVHFFLLTGRGFERLHGSGPLPAKESVFPSSSLLAAALASTKSICAIRLVDPRSGAPLKWGRFAEDETAVEQAIAASLHAQAAVGFRDGGPLGGFLLLGPRNDGGSYGPPHLRFASELASRAAFAAQMALACERKLSLRLRERGDLHRVIAVRGARSALQPPETVSSPLVDLAASSWVGAAGDSFYDVLSLPGGLVAVVSAQSAAGGEDAAIDFVRLQTFFRSRLRQPGADLSALARTAVKQAQHPPLKLFACLYHAAERALACVNAGHLPPVLLHGGESGAAATRLSPEAGEITSLKPGDLLIVFNDGLVNARNAGGESWGERRMLDTLLAWEQQRAEDLVRLTLRTVLEFTGHAATQPDRTLVVLKPVAE